MKNVVSAFFALLIVLPVLVLGQSTGNLRGTVVDRSGKPLSDVNITIQSRSGEKRILTTTDAYGVFTADHLTDGEQVELIFSLVGYLARKEVLAIKPEANNSLLVTLDAQDLNLQEVVVTALGLKKEEKSLGYAIQEIKGGVFQKVKTDKILDQLNGRVAGLTVNSRSGLLDDPAITLRGRTPLYVVNGVPVDYYRAISQDDIERVTVLKGPQASVLYGSRGKDGSIVITTRTAGPDKELEVSFNSSNLVGVGYLTIPKEQSIYGQGEFGKYSFKDGKGGGVQDGMWIWGPKLDQRDPSTSSGWWETAQYNSPIDVATGERVPIPWRSYKNNLRNLLQPGMTTNNSVSIADRGERGGYRASFNQLYRRGMVPTSSIKRYGLNLSADYRLNDRLSVDANIIYSYAQTDNAPPVGYGNDHVYYNTLIYMGANTDVNDLKNYWMPGQEGYVQRNYNYSWFQNPWFLVHEYKRPWGQREVIASSNVKYKFSQKTNLLFRAANNYKYSPNEVHQPYAWVAGDKGRYEVNSNDKSTLDMDMILSHENSWGDFSFDGLAGASWFEYREQNFKGVTVGGLVVPGTYSFSNSQRQSTITGWLKEKRMYGFYGSGTIAWRSRVFLTFTGRNDWSSALAKENRSFFYPSVSLSTVVSDMMKLPDWISFLKVRGSWVKVGRDMEPYSFNDKYSYNTSWAGNPAFFPESVLIDPSIKPSFSTSYEVGMDLRFLRNRIRVDASYFNTLDKNWIQTVNLPVSSGFSTMLTNGNSYRRSGLELTLDVNWIERPEVKWSTQANWFTNRTVLDYIYGNKDNYGNLRKGDRSDAMYAKVYLRDPAGNFVVNANNGRMIVDPFARKLGNRKPDWEAGISNSIAWKKFALSFQISGRWGGLLESDVTSRMIQSGKEIRTAVPERELDWSEKPRYIPSNAVIVSNGEITYNQVGDVISDTRVFASSNTPVFFKDWMSDLGSLGGNYTMGWNVYSGSFVKLRNASLTYDMSDLFKGSRKVKGFETSVIGENLWMWKKLANEDPDADQKTLSYPTERYLGLNFSFKF